MPLLQQNNFTIAYDVAGQPEKPILRVFFHEVIVIFYNKGMYALYAAYWIKHASDWVQSWAYFKTGTTSRPDIHKWSPQRQTVDTVFVGDICI